MPTGWEVRPMNGFQQEVTEAGSSCFADFFMIVALHPKGEKGCACCEYLLCAFTPLLNLTHQSIPSRFATSKGLVKPKQWDVDVLYHIQWIIVLTGFIVWHYSKSKLMNEWSCIIRLILPHSTTTPLHSLLFINPTIRIWMIGKPIHYLPYCKVNKQILWPVVIHTKA